MAPRVAFPRVSLSHLCERISSGGTPSRKRPDYFADSGGHPWVKSQELLDASIWATAEQVSDLGLANSSAKYYPLDTILLAMYGANVGQLGYLRVPATVNQAVCGMCADPAVADSRYLFYALMQERRSLISQAAGAAQQNLNQDLIRNFVIPVPPLTCQRKIGAVLSAYDDLIENSDRRIKLLEEIAQRIYREWFVDFRYPGHEDVPLADSELGPIPEGWGVGVLDDLVVLQRGFDLPKFQREDGTVPVIAATGRHGTHSLAKVSGPGVVTGRSGSLGAVEYVVEDFWPLNTTLWVKEYRRASPESAFFLLRSLGLAGFNSGSAVPTLNRNDISQLAQTLPPAVLVARFSALARNILVTVRTLERSAEALRATRDLLLPRLISGEIDVTDLDIAMSDAAA